MDNWVLVKSFARPKSLWAVRVTHLMKTVGELGLELIACETGPVPPIMQEFLNLKAGDKVYMYAL